MTPFVPRVWTSEHFTGTSWKRNNSIHRAYIIHSKKYPHDSCFVVFCCGSVKIDLPISIEISSLVLMQSFAGPRASETTLKTTMKNQIMKLINWNASQNRNKTKHKNLANTFLGFHIYYIWDHILFMIRYSKGLINEYSVSDCSSTLLKNFDASNTHNFTIVERCLEASCHVDGFYFTSCILGSIKPIAIVPD